MRTLAKLRDAEISMEATPKYNILKIIIKRFAGIVILTIACSVWIFACGTRLIYEWVDS